MENFNVKNVEMFVIVNDAVRKAIFSGVKDLGANQQATLNVTISARKKITDRVIVENEMKEGAVTLTPFDSAVYDAAITEWLAGNQFTSVARIWRILGGSERHKPSAPLYKAILNSLFKMYRLEVNFEPAKETLKVYKTLSKEKYSGRILNFKYYKDKKKINGGSVSDVVEIKGSVLFDVASDKDQIKRVPAKFFNLKIKHTERTITLLHYLIRRAAEIVGTNRAADSGKKNRRLSNSIALETLLRDCGFADLNKSQRQNVRDKVKAILDGLKSAHFISNWLLDTADTEKGSSKIRAIHLTFPSKLRESLNIFEAESGN